MRENQLATHIVDAAYHIHCQMGPGLLESVYERILAYELTQRGMFTRCQVPIPIDYGDMSFDNAFRADLIVEGLVMVEVKSVENLRPVHHKQLLTYLKLADKRLGLLINFGAPLIKEGLVRVVNGLNRPHPCSPASRRHVAR